MPVGDLDELAWNAVRRAVVRGESLAFALPRVEPGISIGPSIRLVIGALSQHRLPLEESVPLQPGDRIALVSRAIRTRHLFAESVLRFNQAATMLCAFQTERLNRKGVLDDSTYGRIVKKRRQRKFEKAVGFEIYDLGPIIPDVDLPEVKVAIVEIFEHDSAETLERLFSFIHRSNVQSTIAFTNVLDEKSATRFLEENFRILCMRASTMRVGELRPSFVGVDLSAPERCEYHARIVPLKERASRALAAAHFRLTDALQACRGDESPEFLRQAFFILNSLSNVSAPLDVYERARKELGRPRLFVEIERLRSPRILHGERRIAEILMSGWSHTVDALQAAYDEIASRNPLAETVVELIVDAHEPMIVALGDLANRDALLSELLIGYGWRSTNVVIEHLSRLSRLRANAPKLVTIGVDGLRRVDTALWSMLPERIDAMIYPHLARRHVRWVEGCNERLSKAVPTYNYETATNYWGSADVHASPRTAGHIELFISRPDFTQLREEFLAAEKRSWTLISSIATFERSLLDEDFIEFDADDRINVDADEETNGSATESITVHFAEGGSHMFSPSAEVLFLDNDVVEPRRVSALKAGDKIVFLAGEQHRSAFETIRERTAHLIDIEERVIELWRRTMSSLRRKYPPEDSDSREQFVKIVTETGCEKGAQTIVSWLRGVVMAPRDLIDVETLITVAKISDDPGIAARLVDREITTMRTFYRQLGHRIRAKATGKVAVANDALSTAIEDFLDEAEERIVASIVLPTAGGA